ncbi:MAG: glutamine synthetase III [Firmicutes bacterium]|nr:glutamine synthetase III [Bacillota bacterium]
MNIKEIYSTNVFNDKVMRERLPAKVYASLQKTIESGSPLNSDVANAVALAMKDWALEKGATHFTHWFQPMTGITAEKHDSFITPDSGGGVILEFSGKSLVQGEPDASSFPSGGLRATFEARGYTAWDPTSYAFIKDGSLCIPTAFCSYAGDVLDKKTPLLRSMQAVEREAKRIMRLFGQDASRVNVTCGAEQEYFLIDKSVWLKRTDLMTCGRTLFGARPPKGQEMNDHYFGVIKPRVASFMKELDEELWKVGVPAKTKHNETAPAQHELAPVFTSANVASDHNQIIMEFMKSIASKHNLACLLHEKPFKGVSGSGKHINWSLSANGKNLLEPGDTPSANAQFLLFLTAVLRAVDRHSDLLRVSVAGAGNDLRLGGFEAPPPIISVYLGEELSEILDTVDKGTSYLGKEKKRLEPGVDVLPRFPKDNSDRNRTSPFAFTGNKFEFRMLGSSFSASEPNIMINTIVADSLKSFADELENSKNFKEDLSALIRKTITNHKRIIFNGNNYSADWVAEATKRGLLNINSSVEAFESFILEKNVNLFELHGVFTRSEVYSRYEILLENYYKTLHIEALTMQDMARGQIMPSVFSYLNELTKIAKNKKDLSLDSKVEVKLIGKLSALNEKLDFALERLTKLTETAESIKDNSLKSAKFYHAEIVPAMNELRSYADELEILTAKKYLSFPTYIDLLFSVR